MSAARDELRLRSEPMRLLLVFAWFLFIASASFWLPAYEGDVGGDELTFALPCGHLGQL